MKFSIKDFFIKFDQIRSCTVVLLYQLNFLKNVKSILKYRNKLKKKNKLVYTN